MLWVWGELSPVEPRRRPRIVVSRRWRADLVGGRLSRQSSSGSGSLVYRVRSAVSRRAEAHLGDGSTTGMAAWGAPQNSGRRAGYATRKDMSHPQAGAVSTTLRYTDYRLEFFGQIESKSIDWACAPLTTPIINAMKFAADGPGPRAIVSMVHYPVVAGVKGRSRVHSPQHHDPRAYRLPCGGGCAWRSDHHLH